MHFGVPRVNSISLRNKKTANLQILYEWITLFRMCICLFQIKLLLTLYIYILQIFFFYVGPKCTNKQTKKNFDKQLLLTGRFEVSIRRRRRTSKKRCRKLLFKTFYFNYLFNFHSTCTFVFRMLYCLIYMLLIEIEPFWLYQPDQDDVMWYNFLKDIS